MSRLSAELETALRLAREAGAAIMAHYGTASATEKEDKTPLTPADLAADAIITKGLRAAFPDIPVVSEEAALPSYEERRNWKRFWLVDPLDGTKEFLKRNGEFTVNIALILDGAPTLGVVFAPAKDLLFYAQESMGSWKTEGNEEPKRIFSKPPENGSGLRVVESRSHGSDRMDGYLATLNIKERVAAGSSLKFCLVAEGRADLYPRLGPTMEWDTAAGDCVWRDSAPEGRRPSPLTYNKIDLRNGEFIIGFAPSHV